MNRLLTVGRSSKEGSPQLMVAVGTTQLLATDIVAVRDEMRFLDQSRLLARQRGQSVKEDSVVGLIPELEVWHHWGEIIILANNGEKLRLPIKDWLDSGARDLLLSTIAQQKVPQIGDIEQRVLYRQKQSELERNSTRHAI